MKQFLKTLRPTDYILLIMLVYYALYQQFFSPTKDQINIAQTQANEAKELIKAQAEELKKLKSLNEDILKVVGSMAKNNQVAKAQIQIIEMNYDLQIDSSTTKINKAKKALDELFRETFKNIKQ